MKDRNICIPGAAEPKLSRPWLLDNVRETVSSNSSSSTSDKIRSADPTRNTSLVDKKTSGENDRDLHNSKAPNSNPTFGIFSTARSLLSTGIFDGIPVKYYSTCRRKSLRGVIKRNRYLCGCKLCKGRKEQIATKFERHAGCNTYHPNNHIHFENGMTITQVLQELRRTPRNEIVDEIRRVTGSPINETRFSHWLAAYNAAISI